MKKRAVKREFPKFLVFFACILISYFVAFIGGLFTSSAVKSAWYESIKPALTPPNFVFPIVWNLLFFLIALSMYYAWNASFKEQRKKIALMFLINFVLNISWSILYFGMQNPLKAFVDIILILISTSVLIVYLWKIDRRASALLIPYFLWVSFASVLNLLSI